MGTWCIHFRAITQDGSRYHLLFSIRKMYMKILSLLTAIFDEAPMPWIHFRHKILVLMICVCFPFLAVEKGSIFSHKRTRKALWPSASRSARSWKGHRRKGTGKGKKVIDLLHKSHSAPVPCPTVYHFVAEMCLCAHFCYKIVHCGIYDVLWDLQDGSTLYRREYLLPLNQCGLSDSWT